MEVLLKSGSMGQMLPYDGITRTGSKGVSRSALNEMSGEDP